MELDQELDTAFAEATGESQPEKEPEVKLEEPEVKEPEIKEPEKPDPLSVLSAGLETLMAQVKGLEEKLSGQREPEKKLEPREEELPEQFKEFVADYPELMPLVNHLAEQTARRIISEQFGGANVTEVLDRIGNSMSQNTWDSIMIHGYPDENDNWIDGHPDAFKVVFGPTKKEFNKFLEDKKINPDSVSDPREGIKLITEFKTLKAKAASEAKKDLSKSAELYQQAAGNLAGGTRVTGGGKPGNSASDDDPDALFNEAISKV